MVELRTREREMRRDRVNQHGKLGLDSIPITGQFTIPDTAGMTPTTAWQHTDMRYSKPGLVSPTPGFQHPLTSYTLFPSSSKISLSHPQSYHHHRTQSYVNPLSLSRQLLPVLPSSPEGQCICPVNSYIWPLWDSALTTPKYSPRLPVTKIHFADENLNILPHCLS